MVLKKCQSLPWRPIYHICRMDNQINVWMQSMRKTPVLRPLLVKNWVISIKISEITQSAKNKISLQTSRSWQSFAIRVLDHFSANSSLLIIGLLMNIVGFLLIVIALLVLMLLKKDCLRNYIYGASHEIIFAIKLLMAAMLIYLWPLVCRSDSIVVSVTLWVLILWWMVLCLYVELFLLCLTCCVMVKRYAFHDLTHLPASYSIVIQTMIQYWEPLH